MCNFHIIMCWGLTTVQKGLTTITMLPVFILIHGFSGIKAMYILQLKLSLKINISNTFFVSHNRPLFLISCLINANNVINQVWSNSIFGCLLTSHFHPNMDDYFTHPKVDDYCTFLYIVSNLSSKIG